MAKQEPKSKGTQINDAIFFIRGPPFLLLHGMDEESFCATNIAYEPLKITTSQRLNENEIKSIKALRLNEKRF